MSSRQLDVKIAPCWREARHYVREAQNRARCLVSHSGRVFIHICCDASWKRRRGSSQGKGGIAVILTIYTYTPKCSTSELKRVCFLATANDNNECELIAILESLCLAIKQIQKYTATLTSPAAGHTKETPASSRTADRSTSCVPVTSPNTKSAALVPYRRTTAKPLPSRYPVSTLSSGQPPTVSNEKTGNIPRRAKTIEYNNTVALQSTLASLPARQVNVGEEGKDETSPDSTEELSIRAKDASTCSETP
ncbi:hypothetical protein VSDG_04774 [Cytospora chrysosperma]|uniref:Uncharacterized protein n=1 Tax=Cytospora chrysosperma TaxID=252740 RepID=A0A423W211_CYTCH|nr:hypothetical protein VSDG_04774 [Valsa sordida]